MLQDIVPAAPIPQAYDSCLKVTNTHSTVIFPNTDSQTLPEAMEEQIHEETTKTAKLAFIAS
jgi:hypothetical protein